MSACALLERLRGGLIVSVQAHPDSPLAAPAVIAVLARCAENNGAVGVRIEGAMRIAAVRAAVSVPIVGLIKREHPGFAPYITSTPEEVAAVRAAGADVVAFDATRRPRPGDVDVPRLLAAAHAAGAIGMADCAEHADGVAAAAAGAEIVATTLAGYTDATRGRPLPALDLVAELTRLHPFVVCEGGVGRPAELADALAAGAAAVVVGTAITDVDALVARFVAATRRRGGDT